MITDDDESLQQARGHSKSSLEIGFNLRRHLVTELLVLGTL